MKKFALLAMLAAAVALTGCTKKADAGSGKLKVGFVYIGEINDGGYTQAQDKSRLALNEMGIETLYKENVSDTDTKQCVDAIHELIDQGCNVIYATSYGFLVGEIECAKEFPKVKFGHCSGYDENPPANLSTYFGKMYEARYLAGIVAGLKTKTNKIGYVAAFNIPECVRGINGFTRGVRSVNPDAVVEVVWTSTWYDPAKEKQGAVELLNRGCDVIEQHQDTTAPQIAAEEAGAWCLGYNTPSGSAAPKAYLTAPIFHWDAFTTDDVKSIINGTWTRRDYWEGLSAGIVDLDALTDNCAPGTAEKVEEARKAIIDGSLQIFAGPINDNTGKEVVPAGKVMADREVWNMTWFVEGVKL